MPKILIFVPCEKSIVSNEGPLSLISILERLESSIPPEISLPEHASIPMQWDVICIWQRVASDEGKRFEQMIHLVAQDGSVVMHTEPTEIMLSAKVSKFRMTAKLLQFPITDGSVTLKLFCREIGTEEWVMVAEYSIEVATKIDAR